MLGGKRIVNTRAVHQSSRLSKLLTECGATVIEYPCIAIAPPEDDRPLQEARANLVSFDWLVLTSANAVTALGSLGERAPRVAAVGAATAKAARECLGVEPSVLPETFTAEALAEALPVRPGERVLFPASALARPTLVERLRARGAEVCVVEAYRTVPGTGGANLPLLLAEGAVDAITFTSASTVAFFLERLADDGGDTNLPAGLCLASIGPQTTAEALRLGLTVTLEAVPHTLEGLIHALENHFV